MGQAVLNPPESLKGLIKKLQVKFERKPLYAESQWNLFFPGLHSTSMHIPTCKRVVANCNDYWLRTTSDCEEQYWQGFLVNNF